MANFSRADRIFHKALFDVLFYFLASSNFVGGPETLSNQRCL